MSTKSKVAASPFARLFGSYSAKAKSEDVGDLAEEMEQERKDRDDEDAPDPADSDEEAAAKRARRKAKKAKKTAAEGDDDSDEEDDADAKARAIRARERGRVKAIMSSGPAAANPAAAMFIALSTNASRNDAIAQIAQMGRPPSSARDRLFNVSVEDVGDGGGMQQPSTTRATADAIVLAGKRRRGEA